MMMETMEPLVASINVLDSVITRQQMSLTGKQFAAGLIYTPDHPSRMRRQPPLRHKDLKLHSTLTPIATTIHLFHFKMILTASYRNLLQPSLVLLLLSPIVHIVLRGATGQQNLN